MKSHIILFFALLLAAFMLSCQQQDSSILNPEGSLRLDKPGKGKGGGNDSKPFLVTVMGDDISSEPQVGEGFLTRDQVVVNNFILDLGTFFEEKLSCNSNNDGDITGVQTGTIAINTGSAGNGHAFVLFQFDGAETGIHYNLELDAIIENEDTWIDTLNVNVITEGPLAEDGHWEISTHGRNHRNGCIGEGDGIVFTITVDPITP